MRGLTGGSLRMVIRFAGHNRYFIIAPRPYNKKADRFKLVETNGSHIHTRREKREELNLNINGKFS